MKRSQENVGKTLDRLLRRYASPSSERMESAIQRVWERLRSGMNVAPAEAASGFYSVRRLQEFKKFSWAVAAGAFAIVILLSVLFVRTSFPPANMAIVETVDGSLYRVANGKTSVVVVGERIGSGKTLRTNGGAGTDLLLSC